MHQQGFLPLPLPASWPPFPGSNSPHNLVFLPVPLSRLGRQEPPASASLSGYLKEVSGVVGGWVFLGLAAALGDAVADALTKRHFTHLSPYGMGLARFLFALPFLVLAVLMISWPALDRTFWLILAVLVPLDLAALLLYMQTLKVCHISLCVSFLAFTPVFMIITGWVFLGEMLNTWGVLGILLVFGGSYILSLGTGQVGFWAPLKALAREKGARLMLAVAALYAFSAAIFKLAILHSSPLFMGSSYPILFTGVLLGLYPLQPSPPGRPLASRWGVGVLLGLFTALSCLAFSLGMHLAQAAYMVALKRLSLLITVLLGGLWLKEQPLLPRLTGVILMTGGVVLIALKGS